MTDTVNFKYSEAHASSEECILNVLPSVHPEAVKLPKLDTTLAERVAAAAAATVDDPPGKPLARCEVEHSCVCFN